MNSFLTKKSITVYFINCFIQEAIKRRELKSIDRNVTL